MATFAKRRKKRRPVKSSDGTVKKPRVYVSRDIMGTLESQYGARFSIAREVTMIDPEESALNHAWWYKKYPAYYKKTMDKRGIVLEDLPDTSNYIPNSTPVIRRIDALMVGAMDSHGEYPRTAVEIKTSRADFKRDTETKRKAWFSVTHRFVYLVPENLVSVDEVPEGCGLWYWMTDEWGNHRIDIVKRATVRHNVEEFDSSMVPYLLGRVARAEAELRKLKS